MRKRSLCCRSGHRWTDEEKQYMEDNWGIKSKKAIAKKLGRTVNAINIMSRMMKLESWNESNGEILYIKLVELVGLSDSGRYREHLIKNGFPITRRVQCKQRSFLFVNLDKFWKWAYTHQDVISFKNFEYGALGFEPAWANEKRERDKANSRKFEKWTKEEESILLSMLKLYRYDVDEISDRLGRTPKAIYSKISRMGIPYWPVLKDRSEDNVVAV